MGKTPVKCFGMRNGTKIKLDAYTFTIIFEFLGCKICPIICDDAMRDAEAKYYRLDEIYCRCGILRCDWCRLYPLGEFIECDQHIDVPTWPRFM
jgi:hypothetical protein